ncbi:hypothetical protein V8J88_21080 [Massilia sp. W12]|uniref:hypothetical protein n=1 Tax=Massilia sp. W12 TaxID=3126507 RepID=UPI0030CE5D0A
MAKTTITIGSRAQAETLFTYPNDGHEAQSLEETIKHYVSDSLDREAVGSFAVAVHIKNETVTLEIEHISADIISAISKRYRKFFQLGASGHEAVQEFQKTGKWSESWKFLLPLGLPLEYAKAVEIMDFPPLSLIKKQDYLNSKTTNRWWELLTLNGVPKEELARYSCIVDIVPVAAPASDGKNLDQSGIYEGPFDSYSIPLLELFSDQSGSSDRRPLIALGLPIRKWIERLWGTSLNILDVATIKIFGTENSSVIASNHPSFFFYAASAYKGTPDADRKNLAAGLAVMKQDIVAAAWHAEIGRNPQSDPTATLAQVRNKWANRESELLELVRKQAGIPKPLAIELEIAELRDFEPTPEELQRLEMEFHEGIGVSNAE